MENKVMLVNDKLKLTGKWLEQIGFTATTLIHLSYDYGYIKMKPIGKGRDTFLQYFNKINKRENIIEVHSLLSEGRYIPSISISDKWLSQMGFNKGSLVIVEPTENIITIKLLDIEATTLRCSYRNP